MSTQNFEADREQARQGDGKFGTRARAEASGVTLDAPSAAERRAAREAGRQAERQARPHFLPDGSWLVCESHDKPGRCDDKCLELAHLMMSDGGVNATAFDETGTTYTERDYEKTVLPRLELDTERRAVIERPTGSQGETCEDCETTGRNCSLQSS